MHTAGRAASMVLHLRALTGAPKIRYDDDDDDHDDYDNTALLHTILKHKHKTVYDL